MPTHASLAPQFSPSMSPPATFSVLTDSVSLVGMLTARVKGRQNEALRMRSRWERKAFVCKHQPQACELFGRGEAEQHLPAEGGSAAVSRLHPGTALARLEFPWLTRLLLIQGTSCCPGYCKLVGMWEEV